MALVFACAGIGACAAVTGLGDFEIANSTDSIDGSASVTGDSGGNPPPTTDAQVSPPITEAGAEAATDSSVLDVEIPDSGVITSPPYTPDCSRITCPTDKDTACSLIECSAGTGGMEGIWKDNESGMGDVKRQGPSKCIISTKAATDQAFASTSRSLPKQKQPAEFQLSFTLEETSGSNIAGAVIAEVSSGSAAVQLRLDAYRLQICNNLGACSAQTPVLAKLQALLSEGIILYGIWDPTNGGLAWLTYQEASTCSAQETVALPPPTDLTTTVKVGCVSGNECNMQLTAGFFAVQTFE